MKHGLLLYNKVSDMWNTEVFSTCSFLAMFCLNWFQTVPRAPPAD